MALVWDGFGLVLISGALGIALQWIWESIPAVGGWGRTDGC